MEGITDWNGKLSFQSEMTMPDPVHCDAVITVSLTWLEIFVGLATIIKDTKNIDKIHKQFDHMLFGTSEVFRVPNSVFNEMIASLVGSEMVEWVDSTNVRLCYYGIDFLMQNWLIDRSVYLNTRTKCDKLVLSLRNEGGAV